MSVAWPGLRWLTMSLRAKKENRQNGDAIAFHSDRDGNPEIYTMELKSNTLKRITNSAGIDTEPVWTPDGGSIKMSDFAGSKLVVFFYPKDNTPGCTTEACNFRDNIYAFKAIGANVVGVSVDDVDSHKEFADKYTLPFILLADVDGEMAESYGVLRDWKLVQIAARQSFIVGPDGTVVKHYEDVDPDNHTQEVLAALETLMAGG